MYPSNKVIIKKIYPDEIYLFPQDWHTWVQLLQKGLQGCRLWGRRDSL